MSRKIYRFIPAAEDDGLRLDQFVPSKTEDLSRSFFRKIVEIGGVHVAKRRVRRCSQPVKAGQIIEIYIDGLPIDSFSIKQENLIYQDKYLLAISKPAGVESQPTPARYKGTLYEAVLRYLHDPFRPMDKPSLGMVQRLDRETSGIMVFSISPKAHKGLTELFSSHSVQKIYMALVEGHLADKEGEFCSLLARKRSTNLVKSVTKGGKEAVTRYRVMEEFENTSLVEIEILTGRSHQIRAHFSEAGHPLLGDIRYGGSCSFGGLNIARQMLHSWQLVLPHPVSGKILELEATVPEDMRDLLEKIKKEQGL